jgi:hypothetical protein
MKLDTYGHVMADAEGGERVSGEAVIRAARDAAVSGMCPPRRSLSGRITPNTALRKQARSRTRTDDPFLTMEAEGLRLLAAALAFRPDCGLGRVWRLIRLRLLLGAVLPTRCPAWSCDAVSDHATAVLGAARFRACH